jgi:flagella basal body P-ring formation protein FlgA
VVRSTRITVGVAIRQRVLVVQRYIARGEILQPGDIVEEVRVIEPQISDPLQHLEDAIGLEARGRLVPGEVLTQSDTLSQVVIKRNSEVWVRARHGLFVIRMRARVLDEGRIGELVRVQRLSDRVELKGIIGADGEVTIDTGDGFSPEESR